MLRLSVKGGGRQHGVSHTTCTSGVSILEPSATNIRVLLIDTKVYIGNSLSESDGSDDT